MIRKPDYIKVNKPIDVPLKKSYASFHKSTLYAYTSETLDVSQVYIPVKRTYAMSIEMYNDECLDTKKFKNIIPTYNMKYIGQEFDYIKKF